MTAPRDTKVTLRRRVGNVVRAFRRNMDAALHTRRSKRAQARLAQLPRPETILVMCYGNICRSPYLEARLRAALGNVEIVSAGFVGPGRSVPAHSLAVAAERGLDLAPHRSRLVSRSLVESADLVIVMNVQQERALVRGYAAEPGRIVIAGDFAPDARVGREIPDPWQKDRDAFEATFVLLDKCVDALVRHLKR